jgi:hypothetical protein
VEPGADFELQLPHAIAHLDGAADRLCGFGERGEESVSGSVDLAATMPPELTPYERVVPPEQLAPPRVTESRGELGRPNDVREQDGREDAPARWTSSHDWRLRHPDHPPPPLVGVALLALQHTRAYDIRSERCHRPVGS